jgi:hypothetical protein
LRPDYEGASIKQHLAAVRILLDYLVTDGAGHVGRGDEVSFDGVGNNRVVERLLETRRVLGLLLLPLAALEGRECEPVNGGVISGRCGGEISGHLCWR